MNNNIQRRSVGIIWANPYSTNLGVAALTYSAIVIFEEIGKIKGFKPEFLLWGSRNGSDTLDINGIKVDVTSLPPYFSGNWIRTLKNMIRRPWRFLDRRHIAKLKNCDVLADTGEGDSYADIYGIERFRSFDYIKKLANGQAPYIMLPQTIGPFNSTEAQKKAHNSLENVNHVIARDLQSYSFCKEIAPNSSLSQSIDMAFFLPYNRRGASVSEKIKVGINISGLLWEGGYTGDNQFGLKDDYRKVVESVLKYLDSLNDIEVHLIGHVVSQHWEPWMIDEDTHVNEIIAKEYPNFIVAPKFKSPIEAKSYIAGMDFFSGARMHACIAAISSGVPVLPMAYSRKFNGLFSDTLTYSRLADLKASNTNEVLALFKDAFNQRESLKSEISAIDANIIQPEKKKLIQQISSLI